MRADAEMTDSPVVALIARWHTHADQIDDGTNGRTICSSHAHWLRGCAEELAEALKAQEPCVTCSGRRWIMRSETKDLGHGLGAGAAWNAPCPDCSQAGAAALTAGSWQPEPEVCICAAIRTADGQIIRGHRHPDCFANMQQRTPKPELDHDAPWQGQGFVTSRNRFVDRAEGMRLMAAAGAFSAHTGLSLAGTKDGTPLFSEDLY